MPKRKTAVHHVTSLVTSLNTAFLALTHNGKKPINADESEALILAKLEEYIPKSWWTGEPSSIAVATHENGDVVNINGYTISGEDGNEATLFVASCALAARSLQDFGFLELNFSTPLS